MPLTLIGDFEVGRELMKADRKRRMSRIRSLEGKHDRMLDRNTPPPRAMSNEIDQLRSLIPYCSVSSMLPAKIDGIIINAKLLQAFMRKLKRDYRLSVTVDEHKLTLEYRNRFNKGNKGVLVLKDISKHFKNFTDIPTLEFEEWVLNE